MHRAETVHTLTARRRDQAIVALLGNPNSGKTSVFNQLTGLRQKVGNFPGVTVDRKAGSFHLPKGQKVDLVDLPGTYSLYPTITNERMVVEVLCDPQNENFPDLIVYVANSAQLEKHLLLFCQLLDLGIPLVLGLNMSDVADSKKMRIDAPTLAREFGVPVVPLNGRTGKGVELLKETIENLLAGPYELSPAQKPFYRQAAVEREAAKTVQLELPGINDYQALLIAHHVEWLPTLPDGLRQSLRQRLARQNFSDLHWQVQETMARFDQLTPIVQRSILRPSEEQLSNTDRVDRLLTHHWWGTVVFTALMFLVFQAIYVGAAYPMDWIEAGFSSLGNWLHGLSPGAWWVDLLVNGIIAGVSGVLVFIPQIAILFFLIALLEEVGYMARAVYLFDHLMGRFGLNGRSIVALISGGACAVPAIMSTRNISNWKERLITILVTPLISCSARIPVYTLLIAFAVPAVTVGGIFSLQGLAFMGLYLLGILAALGSALVFKYLLKSNERSFLLMELPEYKKPVGRNILLAVFEKVKTFTLEAGKIILAISVVLWVLANFGPQQAMDDARQEALTLAQERQLDETATADLVAAHTIEASYAGILGKSIEPAIRPLGFDWKIGIALITSFAAREVFVGTMATIYSIGSAGDEFSVRDRLSEEVDPLTGKPVYDRATAWSLLIFYVFAMQCMSTLAVVRRETNSWKWPVIQFLFMGVLAYLGSLLVYQLLA